MVFIIQFFPSVCWSSMCCPLNQPWSVVFLIRLVVIPTNKERNLQVSYSPSLFMLLFSDYLILTEQAPVYSICFQRSSPRTRRRLPLRTWTLLSWWAPCPGERVWRGRICSRLTWPSSRARVPRWRSMPRKLSR